MKYLIKRNDFLRNAKRLDEKSEFLRDSKLSGNELYQQLIKEEDGWDSHGNTGAGSGPMANDIGWHDSLVGRFLNHLVRKAKVAANLMRIKPLIRRLEGEFDRIAAEGVVYKMDEEQKKLYIKTILYSFFYELKEAVKNGEEVAVIIRLTETAIASLETIKDEELDDETKALMLKELQMFLEFLKQFDEEEVQTEEEEEKEETQSSDDDGILTPIEAEKLAPSYTTMIKNLEALKLIIANYRKVQIGRVNSSDLSLDYKKKYITKEGDTIELIQKNTEINKKNLKSVDILNKNLRTLQSTVAKFKTPDEKIKAPLPAGLALVMEGLILEATIGEGSGKERHKVAGGEDYLTQAYTKLKRDIEVLESTKEKGIGIDFKFLDALVSNAKNTESKNLIKSLYNDINRYLVGDRKATIQEKDPLYKESYEYLMPRTAKNPNGGKIQVVAEKIARFAKRALQFDGENLYGGLGDLKVPLQSFVETTKQLMNTPIVKEEPKKEEGSAKPTPDTEKENSNEGSIFKYGRFVSYIKEADEAQETAKKEDTQKEDTSASDPRSGMSISEKIQDYFDKKCMTVKEFTMEKTEFKKVQTNFENLEKDKNGFIIDGYDPIIEILKLFNRAYKLYMAKNITKRSMGAGVSTDSEYTNFGEKGPYRNNKIFDVWESAVLDIMKDRKYQFVFDKKTKLRVGDELRPNGGANLRKFMTDMLDGESLYKSRYGDGRGKQAELLDKYFGPADAAAEGALKTATTGKEVEENGEMAGKVMENAVKIKPTKVSDSIGEDEENAVFPIQNSFFIIKGSKENDAIQRTFFVQVVDGNFVYLQYTKSFGTFLPYINRVDGKKELLTGEIPLNNVSTNINYTKIGKNDFQNLLKPGKVSITMMDVDSKENTEKIEIQSAYWLTKESEDKNIVFTIVSKDGDDRKKQQLDSILRSKSKSNQGIIHLIDNKDNIIIKKAS